MRAQHFRCRITVAPRLFDWRIICLRDTCYVRLSTTKYQEYEPRTFLISFLAGPDLLRH